MKRRHLLQTAGVALGSAALQPSASIASASDRRAEPDFVRLAVATICTDGFANKRHEPAFKLIPQLGVKHVEFNLWFADQLSSAYLNGLVQRCAKAGLVPACVQGTAFGGTGRDGIIKDVTHKLWLMKAAKRLGCRRVKCTGSKRGTNGGLAAVIDVCRELAPVAEEMDMLLVLENHAGNVLENVADYDAIFEKISSPHVGLCLDTGHFEGAGIALADVVEHFHSRLLHVDLKDCRAFGKGHETVVYGEGVTEFKAFLDLLMKHRYRGHLVMEQAWAETREPIVENLRKGVELFRPYEREA